VIYFFFFQAEDGIRDRNVTGVQTCALPICCPDGGVERPSSVDAVEAQRDQRVVLLAPLRILPGALVGDLGQYGIEAAQRLAHVRSEERRVGKECGSWVGWCAWKRNGARDVW